MVNRFSESENQNRNRNYQTDRSPLQKSPFQTKPSPGGKSTKKELVNKIEKEAKQNLPFHYFRRTKVQEANLQKEAISKRKKRM